MPQKKCNFVAKFRFMGANSSYKAMYDFVEKANDGTIFIPDDFVIFGTPDAIRSGLTRLCRNNKLHRFAKGIYAIIYVFTLKIKFCLIKINPEEVNLLDYRKYLSDFPKGKITISLRDYLNGISNDLIYVRSYWRRRRIKRK